MKSISTNHHCRSPLDWAIHELSAKGYVIDGQIAIMRSMPWSKVTRLSTSRGSVYVKEMTPLFSLEPTLINTLYKRVGEHLPIIIAYNNTHACFVMQDAGIPLREHQNGKLHLSFLCRALEIYGKIQLEWRNHVDSLVTIGVPNWCLAHLHEMYCHLMTQEELLIADGLTDSDIKTLQNLQDTVSQICFHLSKYHISETIESMDFQDNNILIKDTHITIADWGDAVISHPFFSLAACLNSAKRNHDLHEDGGEYIQLQNAYLDNWLEFEPKDRLLEALKLAKTLRMFQVALNFSRTKGQTGFKSSYSFKGYMTKALRDFIMSLAC